MKITLIRHAQVIQEYLGKYNGHIDIPLSQEGLNQTKKLASQLQGCKFDKVYCSDLLRAKQTLEALDLPQTPIFTKELREKSWGRHEGKSYDEITQEGIVYENFEQWLNALDGEDIYTYQQRIKEYFLQNIFQEKVNHILVVTHSGVIKTLLGILNNYTLEEAFSLKIDYTSTTVLEL
jgi:alpha-ribazole phosphatase/probable phosphoglycerate mutase